MIHFPQQKRKIFFEPTIHLFSQQQQKFYYGLLQKQNKHGTVVKWKTKSSPT